MYPSKKITIGLFGFGVVGEGIYKVLLQTPALNASIKKIGIRDASKIRNAPSELFTTNADELLNDPEINVIVELIDDADAAFQIVKKALNSKKSVVSANKKLIAEHHAELIRFQQQNQVSFLYEAAVCGSIPVIRNIEEYYDNDLLNSIFGIVNGSTNFILTKMLQEKLSYEEALILAQELGFAESNPLLDVEGYDALNKLIIILKHAYGIHSDSLKIVRKGITSIHPFDINYANEKMYKIKLIADAHLNENQEVVASVLPRFLNQSSQLANVNNEYNGVIIGTTLADEQFLYGKGAGRFPTSSAVLSDISALRYDYKYEYKKSNQNTNNHFASNFELPIYLSFPNELSIDKHHFVEVFEHFSGKERSYMTGIINVDVLVNKNWLNNDQISIIHLETPCEDQIQTIQSHEEIVLAEVKE